MSDATPTFRPRDMTPAALRRHGPTPADAAVRLRAERVREELAAQRDQWRSGFTRRKVLAGAGAVGVAALGSQLVTTKVAFAADPAATKRTLVVIFLRGGMDGISVVVPAGDPGLRRARPNLAVPSSELLGRDGIFGLHPAMAPLEPLWRSGKMAAVHAVFSPDASRSHFQAQECMERGTATSSAHTGWMDRAIGTMGPGTTFRAIAEGDGTPRSMVGTRDKLVIDGIDTFALAGWEGVRERSLKALRELYTGLDHPLAGQAKSTVDALDAARKIAQAGYQPAAEYPGGRFAEQLKDLARLIKAKVGLRLAVVDLGGWDMHTELGTLEWGSMKEHLKELTEALAAFTADLGPKLDDVNVVTMSEFGRRVAENGSGGVDHGHGGLMMMFGGGLRGGKVHGRWPGLASGDLDQGDVAGANDYRDVLGELLRVRFGVGDLKKVFPDHAYKKIGVTA